MKDFNMGYLSGFMAEKRDIEQKAVEGNMQGYDEKLSGKTHAGICSGIQCVIGQLIRGDPEEGGLVLCVASGLDCYL
mgnify:FL=1